MKHAIITMLLLIPSAVFAGSSSVDQSRIAVQGMAGEAATSRVRVTNTDTKPLRYELSAADSFRERVSANPPRFSLAPGESKDVVLRFRMPEVTQAAHVTLVSSDLRQRSALKVSSGIRIPVELITAQVAGASRPPGASTPRAPITLPNPWHVAVYAVDGMLVIVAAYLVRRRKGESHGHNYQISFV
ncbi:MAG: hypothetical protein HYS45_00415 [Parcubacteria group bacterium]|nr:hypothetical protein [Parcubacteria group bacterium]